jgi:hypothetical protein
MITASCPCVSAAMLCVPPAGYLSGDARVCLAARQQCQALAYRSTSYRSTCLSKHFLSKHLPIEALAYRSTCLSKHFLYFYVRQATEQPERPQGPAGEEDDLYYYFYYIYWYGSIGDSNVRPCGTVPRCSHGWIGDWSHYACVQGGTRVGVVRRRLATLREPP